jgi:hypothetical protein
LALTSLTSGGLLVDVVRSVTAETEFVFLFYLKALVFSCDKWPIGWISMTSECVHRWPFHRANKSPSYEHHFPRMMQILNDLSALTRFESGDIVAGTLSQHNRAGWAWNQTK